MKRVRRWLVIALALVSSGAFAQQRVPWTTSKLHGTPEPPAPYRVERIFPKLTFTNPIEIMPIPGTRRLVVVEQAGRLLSFDSAGNPEQADLFGDLSAFDPEITQAYALTFHPRFAENRFVYVWGLADMHGQPNLENGTRILRFRVTEENPPRLDLQSGTVIFSWMEGGHNGGNLRFGLDGMLYISTGDGASPDPPDPLVTGQDVSDVLSSVLRINVDHPDAGRAYGIPQDNPFVSLPKARGEVWAYGLRNPWRLSFHPKTGDLFVGDVGWELWESICRIQRGGNYGWSITEASKQDVRPDRLRGPTPILPPLVAHPHEEAASITGGEFYLGDRLPELKGSYLYGDWQMGTFWSLRTEGDRVLEHRELCRSALMPAGFGVDPDGELLICDHSAGGLWRLGRNPDAGKVSDFPRQLSQTGLFSQVAPEQPEPGVLPYEINAPRWADHATAERWIAVPGEERIDVAAESKGVLLKAQWGFPAGTVLAKTYSLEMERGNPATRRRIETQILHYDGALWGTYSYRWKEDGSDAELVAAQGDEATFAVKDASAPGGELKQKWRFFSRTECARCHSMWTNFTPGFNALQLDRVTSQAPGRQLDEFTRLGLTPDEPRLTDPFGAHGSLEIRARSYLHANCSTCHRFNGGGTVPIYLNIDLALKEAKLIDALPVQGALGLPEGRVIASGDPYRSVLLYRMATAGRGHMPYLGGRLVDDRGLRLVRDWIASLKGNPTELSEATRQQRDAEERALSRLKEGDLAALDALLGSGSGALSVLFALLDDAVPAPVREAAVAKGSALPDPLRRDLFERFLPEEKRRHVLGATFDAGALLRRPGDAAHGRELFAAVCAACHQVNGAGTNFGPDLSHIGTKWNLAALLEQITAPSKVVEPQWQITTLQMKGGDTKVGFVLSRTESELVLKAAGGLSEKIPAAQIAKSGVLPGSLMPEGLLQGFTAEEAADLLEYLNGLH